MNPSMPWSTRPAIGLLAVVVLAAPPVQADAADRAFGRERGHVAALHELPEEALKAHYLNCSRAALKGSLGSHEIMLCSLGYEILLKRAFNGDFLALLAWSKVQSDETTQPNLPVVEPIARP